MWKVFLFFLPHTPHLIKNLGMGYSEGQKALTSYWKEPSSNTAMWRYRHRPGTHATHLLPLGTATRELSHPQSPSCLGPLVTGNLGADPGFTREQAEEQIQSFIILFLSFHLLLFPVNLRLSLTEMVSLFQLDWLSCRSHKIPPNLSVISLF